MSCPSGERSSPMTFPSWPARVFRGDQPGWVHTLAVLSYAPVSKKCPSLAKRKRLLILTLQKCYSNLQVQLRQMTHSLIPDLWTHGNPIKYLFPQNPCDFFFSVTFYIYAFSRCFYQKQAILFLSVCVFPGNWTHAMLYHWATGLLCPFSWMSTVLFLFGELTEGAENTCEYRMSIFMFESLNDWK